MTILVEYNWLGGGGKETFPADDYKTADGMLWIHQTQYDSGKKTGVGIPLSSVKKVIVDK